jgi:hypothetical protein
MRGKHLRLKAGASCVLLAATAFVQCWTVPAAQVRAAGGATTAPVVGGGGGADALFHAEVTPLLKRYCYDCHGDGSHSGDLALDAFKTLADVRKGKAKWEKVIKYARSQTMPPPDADQPTQVERDALVQAVQRHLYNIDPSNPDPGRVTLRRLSGPEYKNTVRDLLGVDFDPTVDFPQDDTGYGFDNIADVLTLPPMLMEKYLSAAEKVLNQAIPTEAIESRQRHVPANRAEGSPGVNSKRDDGWVALSSADEDALTVPVQVASNSDYVVRVLAYAKPAAPPSTTQPGTTQPSTQAAQSTARPSPIRLSLMVGNAVVRDVEVATDATSPQWYAARVGLPAGKPNVRVAVRRQRGPAFDTQVVDGRVGPPQAGTVLVKEVVVEGPVQSAVWRLEGDRLKTYGSAQRNGDNVGVYSTDGGAAAMFDAPADREYLIRVQAYAQFVDADPVRMDLRVDDRPVKVFDVAAPGPYQAPPGTELKQRAGRPVPQVYEVRARLAAGPRRIAVKFLNDAGRKDNANPNYRDRNLYVQYVEVVDPSSPALAPPMTEPLRRLFVQYAGPKATVGNAPVPHDPAAARALLADFTRRAWRRPLQPAEVDRLVKLYNLARTNGESFHGSIKHAMKAVLVSPSFLFRGEPPVQTAGARGAQPIGEFELASRLSYFLWSTTPDDALLNLADRGELRKNLDAQVKRMLASPKARAFGENFAGQWLQFRNLDAAHPDDNLFKSYDGRLRDAMRQETQLFFESLVSEDRSLMDLLTADYTFVNARLAKHYGIPGVDGDNFRRVSLAGTPRRGVLTHGSVLTLTSNPTRTSPVKRGKWVLENLLGAEPPPPPPDIPPLQQAGKPVTGTLRQQLEKHREDVSCASCHAPMDPIGFGLENFNAVGAWRDKDSGGPIDASSEFANGFKFTGARELVELLAKTRQNDFLRSAAEHMLTYALGRGIEPTDAPAVDRIVADLKTNDCKLSTLITGVIQSVPFQMRRAGEPPPAATADARGQ